MIRFSRVAFVFASLVTTVACSSKTNDAQQVPTTTPPKVVVPEYWHADCDPLVPSHCGFPFPSNTALVDDPSTKTGKRVAFKAAALPRHNGELTDPKPWADSDGFSTGQAVVVFMPGATIKGLPTQDDIETSLGATSPTVLIDAETGEHMPHFSEIDMLPKDDDQRTLMIRPVKRLKDGRRYIVAIRKIVDAQGNALAPSPAFAALRDGKPYVPEAHVGAGGSASIEARRALYADIFGKLEKAGVQKADLQLAWDYTTASRENNTQWLVHMRDDALKTVGEEGPTYKIEKVEENPDADTRRRIHGKFTVPLYLDKPGPGGKLVFGPDKMPKQNGTADFDFVVHVPNSATKTPGALLQNGHGLLGSRNEGTGGYLTKIANAKNYVAFSTEWAGMASDDRGTISDACVSDIGTIRTAFDRQHQGILNTLLLMRMMKGRFWKDEQVQFDGKSAIDPTKSFYRGDSQGGIFGTTYMALSTDVTRGLVSVPGAPYSLLLDRSSDFVPFHFLIGLPYNDDIDLTIVLGMVQMLWDRTEPNGYVASITDDTLPGTPKHDVLIHVAIGDFQVTPLGAHYIARSTKAKLVTPYNRKIWGLEEAAAPFTGSAIVEFEFGTPEAPKTNTPPPEKGDDPHGLVRSLPAAYNQADVFFREGKITQTCSGSCNPE